MYLSIIGSPGCGKSTLFAAFSGQSRSKGNNGTNVAVVDVPDERVDRLTAIFRPKKTVYGRIEIADMAGIHEGDMQQGVVSAKQLQQMRLSDAFLLVLRAFANGTPPDPLRDARTLMAEFLIADMVQVESRLERLKKEMGRKAEPVLEQERALLERCAAHLDEGKPLSSLELAPDEEKALRGFRFLSQKPLMVAVNCAEEAVAEGDAMAAQVAAALGDGYPVVPVCARLEAELALMEPEDQALFMEEYGLSESLRGRLIALAYRTLGLISFLTVGDDECRAWPIKRGICAQEAAAAIHTELSERFIRAETVAYDAFVRYGDFAACKKAGVWRLEGKQYIVQDGDILNIRAGN